MSTPQERLTAVMKERDEALELAARQTRRLILAEQQRDEAQAEAERLRKQLPEGMEHCTIRYRECIRGHAWLTALNWIQRGCPTCAERTVAERQREACADYVRLWRLDPKAGAIAWHSEDAVRATPLVTEGEP